MAKKTYTSNTNLKVITGKVNKIHFYNHENGWASFRINIIENKELPQIIASVNCCGVIPDIQRGDVLTLQGTLEETKKYGKQFKVERFTDDSIVTSDSNPEEIKAFLTSGCIKGVGPVKGEKIFEKFGAASFDIIENDYIRLMEVEGIGKKLAETIHDNYNMGTSIRKIVSALLPYGISTNLAFKLYNKWGINAVEVIQTNPYLLADQEEGIEGVGFKTADSIAMRMGIDPHSPLRLQSLIVYLLMYGSMDGNIYYTYEELLKVGDEYFTGINPDEIKENLEILYNAGKVVLEENRIYASTYYELEKFNARKLVTLHQAILKDCTLNFDRIERSLGSIQYDEGQKNAIETASLDTTGVMILTGGPGTGKSTVTKGIIEMLKQSDYRILCAAPTGRASKRMYEATGYPAYTIHRLLECRGPNQFERNQDKPLNCDAIIIDEASMIDNMLLYRLLAAIKNGTKVIFIGDTDQLPPIGAGNFLRDAIFSQFFPVVHLKNIHRQAAGSLIISNAHAINEGRNIKIRNTENSDCIFMNMDDVEIKKEITDEISDEDMKVLKDEAILNEIVDLVAKKIPEKYGYDPKEVQVLVPMKKCPQGVNNINKLLQTRLNTSSVKVPTKDGAFYIGDKVMQIRNNPKKGVFNGDIGIIEEINKVDQEVIVRYPNNDPTMFDNYVEVVYDFHELDDLVLAYACTIHKSQGSEYPAIVMVVSYQHYIMLQRNLVYTGITRAKKLCYIVGTEKAIYHASNNVPVIRRNTTLVKRMYEYIKELVDEENTTEIIEKQEQEFEEYEQMCQFDMLED